MGVREKDTRRAVRAITVTAQFGALYRLARAHSVGAGVPELPAMLALRERESALLVLRAAAEALASDHSPSDAKRSAAREALSNALDAWLLEAAALLGGSEQ